MDEGADDRSSLTRGGSSRVVVALHCSVSVERDMPPGSCLP